MVVVSVMAVGMDTMNLAMVRQYVKIGNYNITFSHFGSMCGRELEAETLALMVLEANILENRETKVAMVVLDIAGIMAEAEYTYYCPNQILEGEESQRRKREATFFCRFLSSAYKGSSSRTKLLEETHGVVSYFFFTIWG
jgi:hypothetical protein